MSKKINQTSEEKELKPSPSALFLTLSALSLIWFCLFFSIGMFNEHETDKLLTFTFIGSFPGFLIFLSRKMFVNAEYSSHHKNDHKNNSNKKAS